MEDNGNIHLSICLHQILSTTTNLCVTIGGERKKIGGWEGLSGRTHACMSQVEKSAGGEVGGREGEGMDLSLGLGRDQEKAESSQAQDWRQLVVVLGGG